MHGLSVSLYHEVYVFNVNNMTRFMVRIWPRTRHEARSVCLGRQTQILDTNKQRYGIANHSVFV